MTFVAVLLLLQIARAVHCQCITTNDIIVNETSIETATHSLLESSTRFSFDLLRALIADQRNNKVSRDIFSSPHSVWSALVIAYMGARGATEQEIKNVLGVRDTDKVITWEAFGNIRNYNRYKRKDAKEASYISANRIFFQEGTNFKDCVKEQLDNDIAFMDFTTKPQESRDAINSWVEEQTRQRIHDLVPPDGISTLTKMVIANAVYFNESWLLPFDPLKTFRRRFTTSFDNDIFVRMMNTRGRFLYGKSEELNCYALELPYTGNTLSMTILLPNNRYGGIDILTKSLTPERLRDLLRNMYPREVIVTIPKFKVDDQFELGTVLRKMRFRTLFDSRSVDLSGFTGQREIVVDAVHHKAFIDVNEGTEAAEAATAVISSRSSRPIGPATFIADYPFVYFIRDNLSNVILFMGKVQKQPEYFFS